MPRTNFPIRLIAFTSLLILALLILYSPTASIAQTNPAESILVLAPHPDDDILIGAGVTHSALERGAQVTIVYLTNGDFGPISYGQTRQREAVEAQAELGNIEPNLIFLGYPDGYTRTIFETYTDPNSAFTSPQTGLSQTWGERGLGGSDYHTYVHGSPADYNRPNMIADMRHVLETFQPDHIFTMSEMDQHNDHLTAYNLLSAALAELAVALPAYQPTVHKSVVHDTSSTWPVFPGNPTQFQTSPPASFLSSYGFSWTDRESINTLPAMQLPSYLENIKALALARHASQGGAGTGNYLTGWITKDEYFWVENQSGSNQPPHVEAGADQLVNGGAVVQLDGSASFDPDTTAPLTYEWYQVSGSPVTLANPFSSNPTFTAPVQASVDQQLVFELIVNDSVANSIPDSLIITIAGSSMNVATGAIATASTENVGTDQLAGKAIDGVVDGSPGDFTREWASLNEGAGAWLQLDWPAPISTNRIILYDRPNGNDQITAGTILFSDGSSIPVSSLNNDGTAFELTFSLRTITNLRLQIDGVSGTTLNIGLSEIEVFSDDTVPTPTPSPTATPAPLPSPAGHWTFDEGSGTSAVDSEGANDGTLIGAPTWIIGQFGDTALDFDGVDDFMEIGGADISGNWTAALWVRRDTDVGSAVLLSSADYALKLEHGGGSTVGFTHFFVADYFYSYSVPLNTWTHLTYVGTPAGTSLYVNGTFQQALGNNIELPLSRLGRREASAPGSDFLNGAVDDLRIYNSALAPAQIQQLHGDYFNLAPTAISLDSTQQRDALSIWVIGFLGLLVTLLLGTSWHLWRNQV